jgi:hypothetical protein
MNERIADLYEELMDAHSLWTAAFDVEADYWRRGEEPPESAMQDQKTADRRAREAVAELLELGIDVEAAVLRRLDAQYGEDAA